MDEKHASSPKLTEEAPPALGVRNMGEPLRFSDVENLVGFSADATQGGRAVGVITRLALTSDEPRFHRFVESFAGVIRNMAERARVAVSLRQASTVLLLLKPMGHAELWVDTAAVSLLCTVKRAVKASTVVFERDIADITGMSFPCVAIGEEDKVFCLFRQDWRFGFAFDMNPDGKLDLTRFTTTLGSLYRTMRYRHFYDAILDEALFSRLVTSGWFPFSEVITSEFKDLLSHCEAGFDLSEIESQIISKFDDARMQNIRERWIAKPHFAAKASLFDAAIAAFLNKQPVTVIKILLTEIEGVLNGAYRAVNGGQGAKLKDLLVFAEASAERKAGASDTLLFPRAFGRYLREHTFANFDPVAQTGSASSRHAVGHGAAHQDSYTMTRALQAILTLDQLAFYT